MKPVPTTRTLSGAPLFPVIIQSTLARLRSASTPVVGRHHVVATLPPVRGGWRWPGVVSLSSRSREGAHVYAVYPAVCEAGLRPQTPLVRLSVFSVSVVT